MISLEKAIETVMKLVKVTDFEEVTINESLNRILYEDIHSDIDMPPFDKSAMDGFACREEDLKNALEVIETIPAGTVPQKKIVENQCAKIMTGSIMPEGADCVIMVEYTEIDTDNKIIYTKDNTNLNVCYKGEDIKAGQIILKKGKLIRPQDIAVLASVGCANPNVFKRPKAAVISTGSELVEAHQKPGLSQIRNSNGYQLIAQLNEIGAEANYIGIAEDSEAKTYEIISEALNNNDIIILSGGVSMGDFDFVPKVLKKCGINIK